MVVNRALFASLPYDPVKDFAPIAPLAIGSLALVVHPSLKIKSVSELVAYAKANPGKLNYASPGNGTPHHLAMELFKTKARIDVVHVPYKGTPEAIGDTIGGRVCCYWAPLNAALPHVTGGKAVALAVSSAKRSALLPNVPTVAEQGFPGFDYTLWVGLWGPAALPPDIAAKINKDVNAALASPDLKERLTRLGTEPGSLTIPEFTEFVRKEVDETQRILKAAGIKPQ
jgi:tripartite-type tricarboxylate transporter receptor subunit TctC